MWYERKLDALKAQYKKLYSSYYSSYYKNFWKKHCGSKVSKTKVPIPKMPNLHNLKARLPKGKPSKPAATKKEIHISRPPKKVSTRKTAKNILHHLHKCQNSMYDISCLFNPTKPMNGIHYIQK